MATTTTTTTTDASTNAAAAIASVAMTSALTSVATGAAGSAVPQAMAAATAVPTASQLLEDIGLGLDVDVDMDMDMDMDRLCLQDLFVAQARRTPDAVALVSYTDETEGSEKLEMTYRQLDVISDRIAVELFHDFGVRPDSVVGVLLPRSAAYVVAYVAILKAGGAYMPLELVYPKQLLENAVSQTDATLVITNDMYKSRVAGLTHLVLNDSDLLAQWLHRPVSREYGGYPEGGFSPRPNADHLAFVVMSSGTTGAPKGICQVHRSAVHSYVDRFARFPYQAGDRVGAGVFFVWELYRPLCFGAVCVVIPDHVLFDPPAVTKFIQDNHISRTLWTPSLLQLIVDSMDGNIIRQRLAGLRYLWMCGEVVTVDLAIHTAELLPSDCRFMNLYSISECHDVSIGDLVSELDKTRKYATCGLRIPGVHFYIVNINDEDADADEKDRTMKLVPNGETGEVYVGGPVIARGYLNMPEKTAERFVPNPFLEDTDLTDTTYTPSRLYRTGDLGRLLPNGQLEILGRCDFMVKVRGYSVVLGAIETALAKHPKLCSAVVLAVGPEGTDKKIVAYVVPKIWQDPPSAASVRTFLKDHLPTYSIPSTFCVLNALPVSHSAAGKVDRKGLPPVEKATRLRAFSQDLTAGSSRKAPANDTEKMVTEIWCELLQLDEMELSTDESFFEVGGHSLLATRMVTHINTRIGAKEDKSDGITILDIVQGPSIAEIAATVDKRQQSGGALVPVTEAPRINLVAEAAALDASIYPFPTRKSDAISRFRLEDSLLRPRVVFLTGATGYLGVHILSELLASNVDVVCLTRAADDDAARTRIIDNMKRYNLMDDGAEDDTRLVAIAGDLAKPLLGLELDQFKSLALEIDSIIHCGAQVNLIKPYGALKEPNVMGTQEILRLATTNGYVKTKVKPVHYISTNGIFPVRAEAYQNLSSDSEDDSSNESKSDAEVLTHTHLCLEDCPLTDDSILNHLDEGYGMTKWVAERMCTIAESRGLPVSVMRPGNMAGSSKTGAQNPDDLHYLFIAGMIALGCAPDADKGDEFGMDLTPVDFAASAVVQLAVRTPQRTMGQRVHLQNPLPPVLLRDVVAWLREAGHVIESVTRDEFVARLTAAADEERSNDVQRSIIQQLESGWHSFESYFVAATWLRYGSSNLEQALMGSDIACPSLGTSLLAKWFPVNN